MSIEAVSASLVTSVGKVYQQTENTGVQQVAEAAKSSKFEPEDSFTLSNEGQKALETLSLFGTEPGEPITLEDIKSWASRGLNEFNGRFRTMLSKNGIDMTKPITLGHERGTGKLIVTNDHPQAQEIEELLEDNFELSNMYTGITNALSFAKHFEEHLEFADAYEQNPQAAVAQYSYLFNTHWDVDISFLDGGYDVTYNRTMG
ncbi:MAG: hypothetical protein PVH77_02400 [Phycisphaerales bacterium]|jgi:hypothetical protein